MVAAAACVDERNAISTKATRQVASHVVILLARDLIFERPFEQVVSKNLQNAGHPTKIVQKCNSLVPSQHVPHERVHSETLVRPVDGREVDVRPLLK